MFVSKNHPIVILFVFLSAELIKSSLSRHSTISERRITTTTTVAPCFIHQHHRHPNVIEIQINDKPKSYYYYQKQFNYVSSLTTSAPSFSIQQRVAFVRRHHHGYYHAIAAHSNLHEEPPSSYVSSPSSSHIHTIDGIKCKEVKIPIYPLPLSSCTEQQRQHQKNSQLQKIPPITILEATASSQDDLVNMALSPTSQKLTNSDPYGAVLWPAASTVASYLLNNVNLTNKTVWELGTGTGLVSLACSMGGARRVVATDYESLPLGLLQYADERLNGREEEEEKEGMGARCRIETALFDICDVTTYPNPFLTRSSSSSSSSFPTTFDIVVAADIMYEPRTGRALAHRIASVLKQPSPHPTRVIIGDSPGRPGREAFLEELTLLGVKHEGFKDVKGQKRCQGERHELICGEGSTSVGEGDLVVAIMDLVGGDEDIQ